MASRWREAAEARTFLAALKDGASIDKHKEILNWLAAKVDCHDPLTGGADVVLDDLTRMKKPHD